ncbi:hypothetical protein SAY87_031291 [Trapa incisa]|uniref:Uncharacterized protein n=1 Tax=Trapa incisa TaxID=236973 RepID=A0AAN7KT37_9MYRT|nr:hypothetical protein SAY87_031291 [Trapa incisa]
MASIYYTFFLFCSSRLLVCLAVSSVSSSEQLFLNQTLVSPSQIFELGFFTPNGSNNRYVGMWYKNLTPSKYIWVANRAQPLDYRDHLVSLTIGGDGNLRLLDGAQKAVWSTNVSMGSNRSTAVLQDTGNLVLMNSGNIVWQSFDYPTDTLLPGMKIGIDTKTGEKRYLISWRTDTDPSPGNFSVGMTSEIPPQSFTWKGSAPYWRGGQWDKSKFIGIVDMDSTYLSGYTLQQDIRQGTAYYSISTYTNNSFVYMFISAEGLLGLVYWIEERLEWLREWKAPRDLCERYGTCGPFGVCNISVSPICQCLDGFAPKLEDEWRKGIWTGGCSRKKDLHCQGDLNNGASSGSGANQSDYFLKLSKMKLPDAAIIQFLLDENAGGCQTWCLNNCSCLAYSYVDNIGCLTWFDEVMDIQTFNMSGKDLFLRLAYDERSDKSGLGTKIIIISLVAIVGCIIILGAGVYYVTCRRRVNESASTSGKKLLGQIGKEEKDDISNELQVFNFKGILDATGNFSIANKLGQGGFGPVYKAWQLWREGREMEFIDEAMSADCIASRQEVGKCVQVGLLCIQDQPMDRPNMPTVVSMLSGELDLPDPKPPTLPSYHSPSDHEIYSQQDQSTLSTNTMTLTVEGR